MKTVTRYSIVQIENKMQILNDPRVSYEVHKRVHFFAEFATPHGIRVLE